MYKQCNKCLFDTQIGTISFNKEGVCNYCEMVSRFSIEYGTGQKKGKTTLAATINDIKSAGKTKKYDCVIGVSGGTDSSFLLLKAKEWGLRPLAVHYDNTWNSAVATMNISKVTSHLGIDLITHVVNNREIDDLKLSLLKAGVPEFDADTDLAFVQVLRKTAAKYGIKYILEGHSFIAEGISPPTANYFDGKYITEIHKQFGNLKLKSFPNLTLFQFLKWCVVYRQKFIRPFWYIDYSKSQAKQELTEKTGWLDYGGHHLENLATAFLHEIWLPKRFGVDFRNLKVSADVRNGTLSREDGKKLLSANRGSTRILEDYVKNRLRLSTSDLENLMGQPLKYSSDFKTYKPLFKRLKFLFFMLAKQELVPLSFYEKYCK